MDTVDDFALKARKKRGDHGEEGKGPPLEIELP
jgi:hypothetical protein